MVFGCGLWCDTGKVLGVGVHIEYDIVNDFLIREEGTRWGLRNRH